MALLLGLALLSGCVGPPEPKFDRAPRPFDSLQIASALLDQDPSVAGNAIDWAQVDLLHDAYLTSYDELRHRVLAPLAAKVLASDDRAWTVDLASLSRQQLAHRDALATIQSMDMALLGQLGSQFPQCSLALSRLSARRHLQRAESVISLHEEPGVLNLERVLHDIQPTAAEMDRLAPFLDDYRQRLARLAADLADADLQELELRLKALQAEGTDEETLALMQDGSGEEREAGSEIRSRVETAQRQKMNQALDKLDALTEAHARTFAAVLSPTRAKEFEALLGRRLTETRGDGAHRRFLAEVAQAMPQVQSPAESATREALARFISADNAYRRAKVQNDRLLRDSRLNGQPRPLGPHSDAEYGAREKAWSKVAYHLNRTLQTEGFGALTIATSVGEASLRSRLTPLVGEAAATRLLRLAPAGLETPRRDPPDPKGPDGAAMARQFFHWPSLTGEGVDLLLRIWEVPPDQRRAFMSILEAATLRREASFELHERELKRIEDSLTGNISGRVHSALGSYVSELRLIQAEDAASDNLLAAELAEWKGVSPEDPLPAATRLLLASRRHEIPWNRFNQGWFLAPLYTLRVDPAQVALSCAGEQRPAVLQLLADMEVEWTEASQRATEAGISALVRMLRSTIDAAEVKDKGPLRLTTEGRSIAADVAAAVSPLRALQTKFLDEMNAVLPDACAVDAARLVCETSLPGFFRTGVWADDELARLSRSAERLGRHAPATEERDSSRAQTDAPVADGTAQLPALRERYITDCDLLVLDLLHYLETEHTASLPGTADEFETMRHASAGLESLAVRRDELGRRAIRDAVLLLPAQTSSEFSTLLDRSLTPSREVRRVR